MAVTTPIPEPSGLPVIGHLAHFDSENQMMSMIALADTLGEIYRVRLPGTQLIIVSTHALVNELCGEARFQKQIGSVLGAYPGEENWGIAHRILMPAFGPVSIGNMFDEMYDIASQLALKWARHGSSFSIPVTNDFTRLTLDAISLCSMGFRFNSFYSPTVHPFIKAMEDFLIESGRHQTRLPIPFYYQSADRKYGVDIETMRSTAKQVLEERKADKTSPRRDLLALMIDGVDPKTGKHMTDENIMDNLITFLVAGHETTSGLLSFAFLELLSHPEAYHKAQKEVDNVIGKSPVSLKHMSKLPYISAVLRETLRRNATIPLFGIEPKEDTLLAGKYEVKKGDTILALLAKAHTDPKVYGDNANKFYPEGMSDAEFRKREKEFPNSWKPFGNGMRACIGRPFAWQEALLVMAMLLQNFNFVLQENYKYKIKQTLTVKPDAMFMRATLRHGLTPTSLERQLAGTPMQNGQMDTSVYSMERDTSKSGGHPMTILYGSNSGTCQALAQRVASDASNHGFSVSKLDCMDSANGMLPKSEPVIIITASYEGQPTDNAGHFVTWLESLAKETPSLNDVSFAVFGCGNREWAQTFHRIPRLVDASLEKAGGTRMAGIGLSDAADGDVFGDFEEWEDEVMWPSLKERFSPLVPTGDSSSTQPRTKTTVEALVPRLSALQLELGTASVTETRQLSADVGSILSVKRHVEVKLPEGLSYDTGDYLVVLPVNPEQTVYRALRLLKLARDTHLTIFTNDGTSQIESRSLPAFEVFSSYIELSQLATKKSLHVLLNNAKNEKEANEIRTIIAESSTGECAAKKLSVLDMLERFTSIDLPVDTFLSMSPPMRVRQYSISSSPLEKPSHASLTFSVLYSSSSSGSLRPHLGVASNFLSSLSVGDMFHVSVRSPNIAFRLPADPERTPIICVGTGSGVAPFRGFIQQRACMIASGRNLAPALLFFGCKGPRLDDLYREELDAWEKLGAVTVRRAYSQSPELSEGCSHVQDRIWHHRNDVIDLWEKNAKLLVCGSRGVSNSVKGALVKLMVEMEKGKGIELSEEDAEEKVESFRNVRYLTDVFD